MQRGQRLKGEHTARLTSFVKLTTSSYDYPLNVLYVGAAIKALVPSDTVFVVEAATCSMTLADQLQPEIPGTWLNCGGARLS